MNSDKQLKQDLKCYKHEIKSKLLCNTKESSACFNNMVEDIDNYVADNPNVTIDTVIKKFGSADEIADSFFSCVDMQTVRKKINIKKLIAVLVVTVIAVWGIVVAFGFIDSQSEKSDYLIESAVVDESESAIFQ